MLSVFFPITGLSGSKFVPGIDGLGPGETREAQWPVHRIPVSFDSLLPVIKNLASPPPLSRVHPSSSMEASCSSILAVPPVSFLPTFIPGHGLTLYCAAFICLFIHSFIYECARPVA